MGSVHFLLNKTLGKYKIIEHIGNGGMAEVYLGQQINLDREVAIKVLHPFLAEDEGFVTRFKREARIVATLRHPNIVQVYDFDYNEEFEVYYMVMEYITGPTLKERLNNGPFTAQEAASVAAAIADALDYAHRRDMVHRDIKPANIMFTDEGQPVLTDFGIARMLSLTGLTASGAMVGTPAYMAPEIATGQSGTPLSDIYSLGVVLYQIATGRLPFEAEVPMSLVMKHINEPVPPPTQFVRDLPKPLESVILKSLAKQPEARYASGAKMAIALREAMGLKGISVAGEAAPPSPSRTPKKSKNNEQEESPLLRTWPDKTKSMAEEKSNGKRSTQSQSTRKRFSLLRTTVIALLIVLIGFLGWAANEGLLPPSSSIQNLLPHVGIVSPSETSTPSPTDTETPVPLVEAATPAPTTSIITPTAKPTATDVYTPEATPTCNFRAEILGIYTSPSEDIVPPGTPLIAYITLRNGGNCTWPEETHLAFVSDEQLEAPNAIAMKSLVVGEQVQVLLPLRAPSEPGTYKSNWEVHLPDGRSISSPIVLTLEVGDLPTYTPTPLVEITITSTPNAPLVIREPQLLEWEMSEPQEKWSGTIILSASGGTGTYRFYRDTIRKETEILDGKLGFNWRACADLPLKIIVVSGEEVNVWEGTIPYPAPEQCN